jgi:tRNA-2-methylthio-N6-dimethylallyladenosine synthase
MDAQIPKHVVSERYDRLVALQEQISWDENKRLLDSTVEVLVSTGEGKKDAATGRVSGRARDGRLVHVTIGDREVGPGDVVTAAVSYAAPHHLVADAGILEHRPWRGTPGTSPAQSGGTVGAGRRSSGLLTIGRSSIG